MADVQTDAGPSAGSGRDRAVSATVLLTALALLAVITHAALRTDDGQLLDERWMNAVVAGRDTQLTVLSVLGYVSIGAVVAVALVCVVLAVLRGRVLLAVAALVVIAGANVTTQLLKHVVLERADLAVIAPNSLPSGHTTVVAAGVGALCLVSPPALRVLVVPGGAFAVTLTGAATIVAGWHRPTDVVTAVLVTLVWTAAAGLLLGGGPHRRLPGLWPATLAAAGAAIVALVAIGVRPSFGWSGFGEAALVLGVLALVTGVALSLMERVSPTR